MPCPREMHSPPTLGSSRATLGTAAGECPHWPGVPLARRATGQSARSHFHGGKPASASSFLGPLPGLA